MPIVAPTPPAIRIPGPFAVGRRCMYRDPETGQRCITRLHTNHAGRVCYAHAHAHEQEAERAFADELIREAREAEG